MDIEKEVHALAAENLALSIIFGSVFGRLARDAGPCRKPNRADI
jgi:hypothetical protein